jgi:transaldolase
MTRIHDITALGQSIWYDNIQRGILDSGEFQALLDKGVRGVTSNPTIFDKAISGSADYDEAISQLMKENKTTEEVFEALAIADIGRAADMLRSVYDESEGADGFVSIEVSPKLAHDTAGTIAAARHLYGKLQRPNIMIKIPATPEGFPAIETVIGEGINVNATLIFSQEQYEGTAQAYIAGLEKLAASGGDVSKVASVASFFVSRVDTSVDKQLATSGNESLQGKAAVANAKLAYARFKEIFAGDRWEKLAAAGARVQRPLWASTGTKNPAYSDVLYVDTLIGLHTVNTVPPATLDAILDHSVVATTVEDGLADAKAHLARLAEVGVDMKAVTDQLLAAGVESFSASFDSLLGSIESKQERILAGGND